MRGEQRASSATKLLSQLLMIGICIGLSGCAAMGKPEPKSLSPRQRKALEEFAGPSSVRMFTPCDLNDDGKCNQADASLMKSAIGGCVSQKEGHQPGYRWLADLDRDGCVTESDEQQFLSVLESGQLDR